jgi:DMSO/TMAO reductase YedYZ molybdopterin-dependent catalytic subunit
MIFERGADANVTEPGRVVVKTEPLNAEASPRALAEPITPDGAHYVRSNFATPRIDAATHAIAFAGAFAEPFAVTLAELMAMPRHDVTVTLECAGNHRLDMKPLPSGEPWDRGAVSTASWSGVPLGMLLDRAGVRDDVVEIVCCGADGGKPEGANEATRFGRALPLDKARDADTIIAFEMNGRPLPVEHGGPARLIVPGWYGMASVKWLAQVRAATAPFEGWFQRERYVYDDGKGAVEPVTVMKVKSHLVAPGRDGLALRGTLDVWGWAWSGEGAIDKVEVALDGGEWQPAQLDEAVAPHAWRRFSLAVAVDKPGRHTLRARATDAAGNVQPDAPPWNRLGYGNNAVATVVFTVA